MNRTGGYISPKNKSTNKSYDLTPKTKKFTATKKSKNEKGEVTIQSYSILKKPVNKIDEELNQFLKNKTNRKSTNRKQGRGYIYNYGFKLKVHMF